VRARLVEIRESIGCNPAKFYSLRKTARLLGVSTQPIRDWLRRGYLCRDGPRRQFSAVELLRFLDWLQPRVRPFEAGDYLKRICRKFGSGNLWLKLSHSRFVWPQARPSLTAKELGVLIGCHPSLILKAIAGSELFGRRRTPGRWEITKNSWCRAFPLSTILEPELPRMPNQRLIPTSKVARFLQSLGVTRASQKYVRELVSEGKLECTRPRARRRKIFIIKRSLWEFARKLGKTS
jgi:hypothetical protein